MAGHFSEFGLLPEVLKGIEDMGWMLPTDIQAEAIPLILGGGDVLMAAETGSGKTGAFCLPVIQIVHENLRDMKQGKQTAATQTKSSDSQWKMNVNDRDPAFAIDENGMLCQAREHKKWQGCRSTYGVVSGKYYYEAIVTDEGLCRVGWSTETATRDVGIDKESFGFGGTGKKSFGKQFDTYGEPFGLKDIIGCHIDLDNYSIGYSKNGNDFGEAFKIPHNLRGATFFASVTLKNAELRFNFGDSDFKNKPMTGYIPLCKAKGEDKRISSGSASPPKKFSNVSAPSAIIIEPSRELATQTFDQIQLFKKYVPDPSPRSVLLIGGQNNRDVAREISSGVDIIVATPGKLDDFISTGNIKLHNVRFFVLDEVDGLLANHHLDLILRIHTKCPKLSSDTRRLQMIVCSATLHNFDVKKLADRIMQFPAWIDLKGQDSVPDTVHHVICRVDPSKDTRWKHLKSKVTTDGIHSKDKCHANSASLESLSEAVKVLKAEYLVQAIETHKMDQAIVFCRTTLDCNNIEQYLTQKGGGKAMVNEYSCACLHSEKSSNERTKNLQSFKDGELRFLICTDVASRGIDVAGIPFVVQVTMSDDKANYIHRIGRVGRAERMGLAITLAATVEEKVWYHKCSNRGKGCNNTKLVEHGGCSIWYNEPQYLADVEAHLGETISIVQSDMKVPVNQFDGKVVYGQRKGKIGSMFEHHTAELAPSVKELAALEKQSQNVYLAFANNWQQAVA